MKMIKNMVLKYLRKKLFQQPDLKEELDHKYQIDLEFGEVTNIRGFDSHREISNNIDFSKYHKWDFLLLLLINYFKRWVNIIFYAVFVASLYQDINDVNTFYKYKLLILMPLIMQLIVFSFKEIYFDTITRQEDAKINQRSVVIFKRIKKFLTQKKSFLKIPTAQSPSEEPRQSQLEALQASRRKSSVRVKKTNRLGIYESTTWDQVEVGDIIFLRRNETCPADVLILDSCDDETFVNPINFNEKVESFPRYSQPLTRVQKGKKAQSGFDYKKIISGTIKYEQYQGLGYKGYIKLKKDPKGESFDESRIIFREEILRNQSYLYGLVLFTNKRCRVYKNFSDQCKGSFFEKKAKTYFFLSFISMIIVVTLTWFIGSFQSCHDFGSKARQFVTDKINYLDLIVQYSCLMPQYFYFFYDTLELITVLIKSHKYKPKVYDLTKVNQQENKQENFQNFQTSLLDSLPTDYKQLRSIMIGDLVMSDIVCMSKTSTITTGSCKVKSILIEDTIFSFQEKKLYTIEWSTFKQICQENYFKEQRGREDSDTGFKNQARGSIMLKQGLKNIKLMTTSVKRVFKRSMIFQEDNSKKKLDSFLVHDSDIPENLKLEELDDTHYKLSIDVRQHKPKTFFNHGNNHSAVLQNLNLQNDDIKSGGHSQNEQSPSNMRLRMFSSVQMHQQRRQSKVNNSGVNSNQQQLSINDDPLLRKYSKEDIDLMSSKTQEDYYRSMYFSNKKIFYQEAILSMILCQVVNSKFSQVEDCFINDSQFSMEEEMRNFAEFFDIKFICANEVSGRLVYLISIKEQIQEFIVYAINYNEKEPQKLGILVEYPQHFQELLSQEYLRDDDLDSESDNKFSVLLLRHETIQFPHYISVDKLTRDNWDKTFQRLHNKGLSTVVYSKLHMNEDEKIGFLNILNQAQIEEDAEQMYQLYQEWEKEMQILHIAGIKEHFRKGATQVINDMKRSGLNTWLLSADSSIRVIPCAYRTHILESNDLLLHLEDPNINELKLAFRTHFLQMQNQFKLNTSLSKGQSIIKRQNTETSPAVKKPEQNIQEPPTVIKNQLPEEPINLKKSRSIFGISTSSAALKRQQTLDYKAFSILINGQSLKVIQQDKYLYDHFCLLLNFCVSLVGYDISAQQKAEVIELIHDTVQGNKRVLAIGNTLHDSEMFLASDLSMKFEHVPESPFKKKTLRRSKISTGKSPIPRFQARSENPIRKPYELKPSDRYIPNADILLKDINDLRSILFVWSRVFADIMDEFLVFQFNRSLVMVYLTLLLYMDHCYLDIDAFNLIELISYELICTLLYLLMLTVIKLQSTFATSSNLEIFKQQFSIKEKTFKKKKNISFLIKTNGIALVDAIIQFYCVIRQIYSYNSLQIGGSSLRPQMVYTAYTLILISDLLKLVIPINFKTTFVLGIFMAYFADLLITNSITASYFNFRYLDFFDSFIGIVLMNYLAYIMLNLAFSLFLDSLSTGLFQTPLISEQNDFCEIQQLEQQHSDPDDSNPFMRRLVKNMSLIIAKIFKDKSLIDISLQQLISGSNNKISSEKINKFLLTFDSRDTEEKFKRLITQVWIRFDRQRLFYTYLLIEILSFTLLNYTLMQRSLFTTNQILMSILICVQLIIVGVAFSQRYQKHYYLINTVFLLVRTLASISYSEIVLQYYPDSKFSLCAVQCFIFAITFSRSQYSLLSIILSATVAIIFGIMFHRAYESNHIIFDLESYLILNVYVLIFTQTIVLSSMKFKQILMERKDFLLEKNLNQETRQINNVLSILLPKFIRDRINKCNNFFFKFQIEGKSFDIQEDQGNVAILFCDICNFDDIMRLEKEGIVSLLDQLFRGFDNMCAQNGMQKIETVGKTYMAAGGLRAVEQQAKFHLQNSVRRALNLSLEMMSFAQKFRYGQCEVQIKIGVHYGKAIAGVIGLHKPQFSLIGDTVNTTSRVCSTGQECKIILSQQAYEQLGQGIEYNFTKRLVSAKGKGQLETYVIDSAGKLTVIKRHKRIAHRISRGNAEQAQAKVIEVPLNEESSQQLKSSLNMQQSNAGDNIINQRPQSRGPTIYIPRKKSLQMNEFHQQLSVPSNFGQNAQGIQLKAEFHQSESQLVERSPYLQALEANIRREISLDLVDDYPEYEVETEKARLLYISDQENESTSTGEQLILDPKQLYLWFPNNQKALASEFEEKTSQQTQNHTRILLVFTLLYQIFRVPSLMSLPNGIMNIGYALRGTSVMLMLFQSFFLRNQKFQAYAYNDRVLLLGYFLLISSNTVEMFYLYDPILFGIYAAEAQLIFSTVTSFQKIWIGHRLIMMISFTAIDCILMMYLTYRQLAYYFALWCVMIIILQFVLFKNQVNTLNNQRSLENKKSQSSDLVRYLLPNHILGQFLSNSQRVVLVDNYQDATILFADIAGFTEYSSSVEPEQVVYMLRKLFTEFDRACLEMNTYKLYTIGDCYVVLGVVDGLQRDPATEAKNVVEMGFRMIDIIADVRSVVGFQGLDMRIGVHTGNIIGGILGTEIVRYDVYGSDVMIANKMESNGERARVQVSTETKDLLETMYASEYEFEFHKNVMFNVIDRQTSGWFIKPKYPSNGDYSSPSGFSQSPFSLYQEQIQSPLDDLIIKMQLASKQNENEDSKNEL